jgi:prolyl-tRNA synthetase
MIGAVIMAHGDDSGLRLPPRVAPVQAVLVPIAFGNWKETVLPAVLAAAESLKKAGVRVQVDAREEFTPGWKFAEHEMRGVPLRIEIGPRDVKSGQAILVRRDAKTKEAVSLDSLAEKAAALLDDIQASLFKAALQYREENTREAGTYGELKDLIETKRGFVKGPWCGGEVCEDKIKAETMATIRVIPPDCEGPAAGGKTCVCCGREAKALAYFARAY